MEFKDKKVIVAYFSHKGQNYCSGKIIDLPIGNTEIIAKMITDLMGADIFKIEPVHKYPVDYNDCVATAKSELRANLRPKLTENINVSIYDIIYIGYPNWCGTMPMPVWTFLEEHNLSGKIIFPFCTHEGSGMGKSESDLKKLCPNSEIKKGLAIHGSSVKTAEPIVSAWIMKDKT